MRAALAQVLHQHGVEGDLGEERRDAALVPEGRHEDAVGPRDAVDVLRREPARDEEPAEGQPLQAWVPSWVLAGGKE